MADPKSSSSPPEKNMFERAKEEIEAVVHNGKHKHHQHNKETHGLRDDINANTPVSDVKAPNVFERAKEEIEAIVEAIHPKKESKSHDSQLHEETRNHTEKDCVKSEKPELHSEKEEKTAPSLIEKAKQGMESLKHRPHHHKESHGRSDYTDESEVKAPNVFERAKEEIEAVIDAIHPKKDPGLPK